MADGYKRGQTFGRPKSTFHIQDRLKVLKHISDGKTIETALDMVGVSYSSYRRAKLDDPDFGHAVDSAVELRDGLLFELLYDAAKGGDLRACESLLKMQTAVKQFNANRRDRRREFEASRADKQPKETFQSIIEEYARDHPDED